ncbi:MAG: HlyC/CorC family transporter [Alphaproteobacteria bacterium]
MDIIWMLFYACVIIVLLMVSGFFSGSETALTAVSKLRIHHAANNGDKQAKRVLRLLEHRDRLLGTILLGNNLVNIFASALSTSVLISIVGEAGIIYATLGLTLLIVIFAEVLPKSYALFHSDQASRHAALPMLFLVFVLRPITELIQWLVRGILACVGLKYNFEFNIEHHEEELRGAIDLHRGDDPEIGHERHMMKSILDLDEITVEDVMTHRKNVEMVDLGQSFNQTIDKIMQSRYTRLPIYRDDQDGILGVIHAKALLKAIRHQIKSGPAEKQEDDATDQPKDQLKDQTGWTQIDLEKLAYSPWFIPNSTSLMDQLLAFRERREHFAMVVDEYGSLMGIVTLEDILEEIVGNIDDETDLRLAGVKPQTDGTYIVDGSVSLRNLERDLEWDLQDEEAITLAGLILNEARRIPAEGQIFMFYGFRFEIKKRSRNQIREIIVTPPPAAPTNING